MYITQMALRRNGSAKGKRLHGLKEGMQFHVACKYWVQLEWLINESDTHCTTNQKQIIMETRVIRIEGRYEIIGFFQEGVLIKTRKLLIPFRYR